MSQITKTDFPGGAIYALQTERKDLVVMQGSYMGGHVHAPNDALVHLMVHMLDQGTTQFSKDRLSEDLESMGIHIDFDYDAYRTYFSVATLKDVWSKSLEYLKSQLVDSAFEPQAFAVMKDRLVGMEKERLSDTKVQAMTSFLEGLYEPSHPNYQIPTKEFISQIEAVDRDEVVSFYGSQKQRGQINMALVGDVNQEMVDDLIQLFSDWGQSDRAIIAPQNPGKSVSAVMKQSISGKVSADVIMGGALGMSHTHPDYLPLRVGLDALGGNMSARLMQTVRDKDGLTYGIYTHLRGASDKSDGSWHIWANYAPDKIQQGIDATQVQLARWKKDMSDDEINRRIEGLRGTYMLSMASCAGLANLIHRYTKQGYDQNYVFQYPEVLKNITPEQVRKAINEHVDIDNLLTVIVGELGDV